MALSGTGRKVIVGAVVVAALAAIVVASWKPGNRGQGEKVQAEAVGRRAIARWVKASGQIDPRVKVNISAHVIGKIDRLLVKEGQAIVAGDPFLELERQAFVAARDQAAAQLAIVESRRRQAEIRLQDAELKYARMTRLHDEGIASVEQREQAELQRTTAELALEEAREAVIQARAALDKAEDDLSKATIFAPLTGRVIALNAEEGEVVVSGTMNNPASVIGTIADLSEILAEVDVDETEVAYLALGQPAELTVDALPDREYRGRVVEIGSSGYERPQQPDVTYFKVKILLENPDDDLRPGMSVRASVRTAVRQDALVVPIQSVVDRPPLEEEKQEAGEPAKASAEEVAPAAGAGEDDEEIQVVFVVGEDGRVQQRAIEDGLSDATHVEVISGLEEGELVVTGPYRVIKDLENGDPVRVREEDDEEEDEAE